MRRLLPLPILLLAIALAGAAEPAEKEPPRSPERIALDKLHQAIRENNSKGAQQAYEQIVEALTYLDRREFATDEAIDAAWRRFGC